MNTSLHELALVARLFGRLFVREVDEQMLHHLRQPQIREALAGMDLAFPVAESTEHLLESLSVEYCSAFLVAPDQVVLVQSLWEQGTYEGEAVRQLRELADAADLSFDKDTARGSPIDHLGCILQLWAQFAETWPEARNYLTERHLNWAVAPLHQLAVRAGFYARLASATLDLIKEMKIESTPNVSPAVD